MLGVSSRQRRGVIFGDRIGVAPAVNALAVRCPPGPLRDGDDTRHDAGSYFRRHNNDTTVIEDLDFVAVFDAALSCVVGTEPNFLFSDLFHPGNIVESGVNTPLIVVADALKGIFFGEGCIRTFPGRTYFGMAGISLCWFIAHKRGENSSILPEGVLKGLLAGSAICFS